MTSLSEFSVRKQLGEGAYSIVYLATRKCDKRNYALKIVKMPKLSDKERANALSEVRFLASLRHKNIIGYKAAFIDEPTGNLCIVMEFADGGDLTSKVSECKRTGQRFPEDDIWKVLIQLARGLAALHAMNIMHRDLKSANVFLSKDMLVRIGDMNVSRLARKDGLNYTQTGTPYYASPEVWRDEPYDFKSDMWSLGCVSFEMACLKPPFQAPDMNTLYKKVLRG